MVLTLGAWGGRGHPVRAVAQTVAKGEAAQRQSCAFAARSKLQKELIMEKYTRTADASALEVTAAQCIDLILLRSKGRMYTMKGPYLPKHKAYMALACAATEAINAFLALDESMK
jgi:hypothetical protein